MLIAMQMSHRGVEDAAFCQKPSPIWPLLPLAALAPAVSVSVSRQTDKKSSKSPGFDLIPLSSITGLCKHFNPAKTPTTSKHGDFL